MATFDVVIYCHPLIIVTEYNLTYFSEFVKELCSLYMLKNCAHYVLTICSI
jgi:hypothetical protein